MNDIAVEIPSGTYVIAVSGGVDSMSLLDILSKNPAIKLIVAHFDHGIRPHSEADRLLVQKTAAKHHLPFVFDKANMGIGTSEAEARKARYKFLKSVKQASGAQAIITAHHQDDIIETAIHNILRGTNRKGLNSLKSIDGILRPITHIDKSKLYDYAKTMNLEWNEDSTNQDLRYRRNYIRHKIVPRFNNQQRQQLINILKKSGYINQAIDKNLEEYLGDHSYDNKLERYFFNILPYSVAIEIMATWLRLNHIRDFDSKLLDNLTIGAKTFQLNQLIAVNAGNYLKIEKNYLALIHREC